VAFPWQSFRDRVSRALGFRRRSYEGASGARLSHGVRDDGWRSAGGSRNSDVLAGLSSLRDRSRHVDQNNPFANAATNAWAAHAVGAGLTPTFPTVEDREARRRLGSVFPKWSRHCDGDQRNNFHGLVFAAMRGMVVDGEAVIHMIATPDGLRLRLIPPELLDASHNVELGGGARIIAGVEFDALGQRVAYHVRPFDPAQSFDTFAPPVRIPASEIVHMFRLDGAGQVRGVPWAAPVLTTLRELDQLLDALLVGAKTSAMFAGFLTDVNGAATGESPFDGQQAGSLMTTGLEPGTLKVVPPGWDLKFVTPGQAQQLVDFAKLSLRSIAAGYGVPEHLMTADVSNANYSSLRAALVDFRRRIEVVQFHILIPQLLRPVWERFVTLAVLSGELDLPDFETNADAYFDVEWIPPVQEWVDPQKDAEATAAMIRAGLMSRRQAVAAQGYDIETLDAEIAADRARETSLGLSFGPDNASEGKTP
jgi:lambda family phage portal protein